MAGEPRSDSLDTHTLTGVPGLDELLRGGLTTHRLYLIEGLTGVPQYTGTSRPLLSEETSRARL